MQFGALGHTTMYVVPLNLFHSMYNHLLHLSQLWPVTRKTQTCSIVEQCQVKVTLLKHIYGTFHLAVVSIILDSFDGLVSKLTCSLNVVGRRVDS